MFLMKIILSYIIKSNDSVTMCKLNESNSTVETYSNNGHVPPSILNPNERSIGLSKIRVLFTNGWLVCSFERQIQNDSIGDKFFDLNNMYYLLTAKGDLDKNCIYKISLLLLIFI